MYLFSDLERSGLFAQTFSEQLKVLNFLEFEKRDGRYYLSGTLCYGVLPPENGSFVYMSNRYADINSPKVTKQLSKMDAEENNRCLNPSELAHKIEGDYKVEQTSDVCAYGQMDGFDFTSSQKKAFVHLLKNSLTVLQGPPGTGKTDFIARAILAMCRYFKKEKGILLRVMVSANSHAAIENVLFAVADKMGNEKDILLFDNAYWLGIALCAECHSANLTDNGQSSLEFMEAVNSPAFRMYWQPHESFSEEENLAFAKAVAPFVVNVHTFYWKERTRLPLKDAWDAWKSYIKALGSDRIFLLEHIPDDDKTLLFREADTLRSLLK